MTGLTAIVGGGEALDRHSRPRSQPRAIDDLNVYPVTVTAYRYELTRRCSAVADASTYIGGSRTHSLAREGRSRRADGVRAATPA